MKRGYEWLEKTDLSSKDENVEDQALHEGEGDHVGDHWLLTTLKISLIFTFFRVEREGKGRRN